MWLVNKYSRSNQLCIGLFDPKHEGGPIRREKSSNSRIMGIWIYGILTLLLVQYAGRKKNGVCKAYRWLCNVLALVKHTSDSETYRRKWIIPALVKHTGDSEAYRRKWIILALVKHTGDSEAYWRLGIILALVKRTGDSEAYRRLGNIPVLVKRTGNS